MSREEKITKSSISIKKKKKVVRELSGNRKHINIEAVIKAVSKRFNISVSQLQSKRKTRSLALPRQIAMHISRKLTNMSLLEIGGYIGGRDHSTVIYADEKITKMSMKDKNLQLILQKRPL